MDIGYKTRAFDRLGNIPAITGVLILRGPNDSGEDVSYFAGDESGYVLSVSNPWGTQEQANAILAGIKLRGFSYTPFKSTDTLADPAAEIGDAVSINGITSIIVGTDTMHTALYRATLTAPGDEEVDHEFAYEPAQEREFKREQKYTRARLTINEEAITAEAVRATAEEAELAGRITITADAVTAEAERATAAEGALSGRIDVQATQISAKVSKSGGSASSFGWTLTDSSWTLTAGNRTVLSADSSGITIDGAVTAKSGSIGGWTVDTYRLEKEVANNYRVRLAAPSAPAANNTAFSVQRWDSESSEWKWKFYVRYDGLLYANNVQIEGNIKATSGTIGDVTISNGKMTGIRGGSSGHIASGTLESYNYDTPTITSLGSANDYGAASSASGSYYSSRFRTNLLYVGSQFYMSTGTASIRFVPTTVTIGGTQYTILAQGSI